jgi:hypothetical protein
VVAVKNLAYNGWIRLMVIDPETSLVSVYERGEWHSRKHVTDTEPPVLEESTAS